MYIQCITIVSSKTKKYFFILQLCNKEGQIHTLVLFSHGPNKDCVVPESCRATVNGIIADLKEDTIAIIITTLVTAIFRQFCTCFGLFDIAG